MGNSTDLAEISTVLNCECVINCMFIIAAFSAQ